MKLLDIYVFLAPVLGITMMIVVGKLSERFEKREQARQSDAALRAGHRNS